MLATLPIIWSRCSHFLRESHLLVGVYSTRPTLLMLTTTSSVTGNYWPLREELKPVVHASGAA